MGRLASLFGVAVVALCPACGSSGSDDGSPGNSGPGGGSSGASDAGGPGTDGGTTPGGFVAAMRLGGWGDKGGFFHPPSKRIVAFPAATASSLSGLLAVATEGAAKGTVQTLAVKGTVPDGTVEAAGYDAASDRFVLVVRGARPNRIDLATVTLAGTDATFTTLAPENPPAFDGAMFDAVVPAPGGVTVVRQSGERYAVTIADGKATWAAPSSTPFTMLPKVTLVDAARGRRIAFGDDEVDAAKQKLTYRAKVFEQPFASSSWSEIPMSGDAPPDDPTGNGGIVTPWAALDEAGDRLVVVQLHESSYPPPPGAPPGPMLVRGSWVADLATHRWTKLADSYSGVVGYAESAPFATDAAGRRAFTVQGQTIVATSLDPATTGVDTTLALDGALPPRFPVAALALDGARVAVTGSTGEVLVWTGGERGRFEPLATAHVPTEIGESHVLARDPASGKLSIFGGARQFGDPAVAALYDLSADGKSFAKRETTNPPPPRQAFGAATAGATLYVVGGLGGAPAAQATTPLDDVWSLDLASGAWKRVATLPAPRVRPAASVLADGRLLVAGGYRPSGNDEAGVASVVTVDPKTGAVAEVTVDGAWPHRSGVFWASAPFGAGVVAIDSGDTVDMSETQLWELDVHDDGRAAWTGHDLRSSDWVLYATVGAIGGAGRHAVVLGRNVWEITH